MADKTEKKQKHEELYNLIRMKYYEVSPKVKQSLQKSKFINYYFKERPKIKKWNKHVNSINFKLFGIKIIIAENFKKALDQLYIKNIFPIQCFIPEILKNGWRGEVVTIKEYNLIVYFKDFCDKLQNVEKEKLLSDRSFQGMEESFLKLVYKKNFPDLLAGALKKTLTFLQKSDKKKSININTLILNIKLFFLVNHFKPSFFELILSKNMVKFKRYVELSNVVSLQYNNIIPVDFYNCSKETFIHIVLYIENIMRLLRLTENEKEYIDWIKMNSFLKKDKTPLKIKNYYENHEHDWEKDVDDMFLLLILLIEGIIKDLNEVMHFQWHLMTDREEIIRTQIISAHDIDVYYKDLIKNYELVKLRHSTSALKNIDLNDFLKSDNIEDILTDKIHLFIYEKMQDIFFDLRNIARIFHDIYKKNVDKPNHLLNFMIIKSPFWKGKSVNYMLLFYMELFLQICGFFKEKKLILELNKDDKINEQIKYYNDKIKWMSDSGNIIINELRYLMNTKDVENSNE